MDAIGAPEEYVGFVVVGGAMTAFWLNVLWSMSSQLYWEKEQGNLALYIIAPNSMMAILLGILVKIVLHLIHGASLPAMMRPKAVIELSEKGAPVVHVHDVAAFTNWLPLRKQIAAFRRRPLPSGRRSQLHAGRRPIARHAVVAREPVRHLPERLRGPEAVRDGRHVQAPEAATLWSIGKMLVGAWTSVPVPIPRVHNIKNRKMKPIA